MSEKNRAVWVWVASRDEPIFAPNALTSLKSAV
jgi:hypothetical protein